MKKIALFLVFGLPLFTYAQGPAIARLDSNWVETGDSFVVHLAVPFSAGTPARVDFTPWEEVIPPENRLRQSPWTRVGQFWMSNLTLITFDSALLQLPGLPVSVSGGRTLTTNGLQIEVYPTPAPDDPNDIADIKDIRREPFLWLDLMPWFLATGVLALVALAYWLFLRRKKGANSRMVILPPHELALKKLEQLERKTLPARLFYDELTYILREYIQRQLQIQALESTSLEIMRELARVTGTAGGALEPIGQMLTRADLVKYARVFPETALHPDDLQAVRQLVLYTMPKPGENTSTS